MAARDGKHANNRARAFRYRAAARAANSAVCYSLRISAVDPIGMDFSRNSDGKILTISCGGASGSRALARPSTHHKVLLRNRRNSSSCHDTWPSTRAASSSAKASLIPSFRDKDDCADMQITGRFARAGHAGGSCRTVWRRRQPMPSDFFR
jgi:hypothetical protein